MPQSNPASYYTLALTAPAETLVRCTFPKQPPLPNPFGSGSVGETDHGAVIGRSEKISSLHVDATRPVSLRSLEEVTAHNPYGIHRDRPSHIDSISVRVRGAQRYSSSLGNTMTSIQPTVLPSSAAGGPINTRGPCMLSFPQAG